MRLAHKRKVQAKLQKRQRQKERRAQAAEAHQAEAENARREEATFLRFHASLRESRTSHSSRGKTWNPQSCGQCDSQTPTICGYTRPFSIRA